MKVILNKCYGGFGLSFKAMELYAERKYDKELFRYKQEDFTNPSRYIKLADHETSLYVNYNMIDLGASAIVNYTDIKSGSLSEYDIERTDELMIEIIEEIGEDADGSCANLEIVDIPDDMEYEIDDYDGIETLRELHRTW